MIRKLRVSHPETFGSWAVLRGGAHRKRTTLLQIYTGDEDHRN